MNQVDFSELSPARQILAKKHNVLLDQSVPRGYVRHIKTGTLYKIGTWFAKVRAGKVLNEDGQWADSDTLA